MPTYDYLCNHCGHRFEEFQNINDDPIRLCPICENESVRRLISPGNGFIFKGSGFYTTDYRSESYKKDKEKAEKSANPESNSSESKNKEKSKPTKMAAKS